MSASSYDEALKGVLAHEGGYTNDAEDPGGPTNWGITIYDARAYWKKNATAGDVRAMPLDVAKQIYRTKYWHALFCDDLPAGVDYAVFDYGVNSGIGRAGKVLRRVLGLSDAASTVNDDAIAMTKTRDPQNLVNMICDERLKFLKGLSTWGTFGKGWGRRVADVRRDALAMAASAKIASMTAPRRGEVGASPRIKSGGASPLRTTPPPSIPEPQPKPNFPPVKHFGIGAVIAAMVAAGVHLIGAHPLTTAAVLLLGLLLATFLIQAHHENTGV